MSSRTSPTHLLQKLCIPIMLLCLAACSIGPKAPPGIGPAISWQKVPGWSLDKHADSIPALLASCQKLASGSSDWAKICSVASEIEADDHHGAKEFYETWFLPHAILNEQRSSEGLLTGYYEPLLHGSRQQSSRYSVPAYAKPSNLIRVELDDVYPELSGLRIRGQLVGDRLIPFPDRQDINDSRLVDAEILVWLDDPLDLFFLQIQGSGRVAMDDGTTTRLGYADQNGHPYHAIGRELVERGELELDKISMFSIRDWLDSNPEQVDTILNTNPSYVFFVERDAPAENQGSATGPIGSLNVNLSPERSLAIDPSVIELGLPVWVDTTLPTAEQEPYQRLMHAQDTGGAIKGYVRADVFFGTGERAKQLAGSMKQPGRLYVLKPKTAEAL
jgi:membrane-bound lytic murein transglycosylase A